jgi:hypothetical protein
VAATHVNSISLHLVFYTHWTACTSCSNGSDAKRDLTPFRNAWLDPEAKANPPARTRPHLFRRRTYVHWACHAQLFATLFEGGTHKCQRICFKFEHMNISVRASLRAREIWPSSIGSNLGLALTASQTNTVGQVVGMGLKRPINRSKNIVCVLLSSLNRVAAIGWRGVRFALDVGHVHAPPPTKKNGRQAKRGLAALSAHPWTGLLSTVTLRLRTAIFYPQLPGRP